VDEMLYNTMDSSIAVIFPACALDHLFMVSIERLNLLKSLGQAKPR
jgi:hypothetical protein